jgi:hypothetical protein
MSEVTIFNTELRELPNQVCQDIIDASAILHERVAEQVPESIGENVLVNVHNRMAQACGRLCNTACIMESRTTDLPLVLPPIEESDVLEYVISSTLADQAERYDGLVGILNRDDKRIKAAAESRIDEICARSNTGPIPRPVISDGAYQRLVQLSGRRKNVVMYRLEQLFADAQQDREGSNETGSVRVRRVDVEALYGDK